MRYRCLQGSIHHIEQLINSQEYSDYEVVTMESKGSIELCVILKKKEPKEPVIVQVTNSECHKNKGFFAKLLGK